MRMKKIILIAAVAIAAAACSKTFDTNLATDENPISFGSWNEVLTKARATGNDNTAFADGEKFDVFGVKTVGSNTTTVFDGVDVEATVSGTEVTWDYEHHRFWDSNASQYTFYAVMPNDKLASSNAETGAFTSNDITFSDPTAFSNDIMVADKKVVAGTGSQAPYSYSSPVALQFNHIASSVDLFVKKDVQLKDATVTVTDLSLVNIKNVGSFAVTGYDNSTNVPAISWTAKAGTLGTSNVYPVLTAGSVEAPDQTTYTNHNGAATTMTAGELFSGYVFMPQDLDADQKVRLTYTINVDGDINTYTDVEVNFNTFQTTDTDNNSGTDIDSWNLKTHYTYYITIGANVITFTANVKTWENTVSAGYHYILN